MTDKTKEAKDPGPYMALLRDATDGLGKILSQVETGDADPNKVVDDFADVATRYVGGDKKRLRAMISPLTEQLFKAVAGYNAAVAQVKDLPRALQPRAQILGGLEKSIQGLNGIFIGGVVDEVAKEIDYKPTEDALAEAKANAVHEALAGLYKKAT